MPNDNDEEKHNMFREVKAISVVGIKAILIVKNFASANDKNFKITKEEKKSGVVQNKSLFIEQTETVL